MTHNHSAGHIEAYKSFLIQNDFLCIYVCHLRMYFVTVKLIDFVVINKKNLLKLLRNCVNSKNQLPATFKKFYFICINTY